MFNGIIERTGKIVSVHPGSSGARLEIDCGKLASRLKAGESIAMDGVCLTVTQKERNRVRIDVSGETWKNTNLRFRKKGQDVNLELPLSAGSLVSGHFVQGHVEGLGRVKKWHCIGEDVRLFIELPSDLIRFCVLKGSIAVNGVSLTIASQRGRVIGMALIPYTLQVTNLSTLKQGDLVNIETDILGRYVVSALENTYHKTRSFAHKS